jgi:hypothetical protein
MTQDDGEIQRAGFELVFPDRLQYTVEARVRDAWRQRECQCGGGEDQITR